MTLEQYFHLIINKPRIVEFKEKSMLDLMKTYFKRAKEVCSSLYSWDSAVQRTKAYEVFHSEMEQAKEALANELKETLKPEIVDYWAFEIQTSAYECDGEIVEAQHDIVTDSNDGTWMETLDQILDVMGKHYGYNIKEQVYYSVTFPQNNPEFAGYGRELNDEVLQKLLLSFPEVYEPSNPTEWNQL